MSGLRLNVYRSSLGDCSNGGISGRCDAVTLVVDDDMRAQIRKDAEEYPGLFPPALGSSMMRCAWEDIGTGPFEPNDDAPEVRLERRVIGRPYYTVVPVELIEQKRHRMFGGTYVRGDSRFPFDHPVALHDRTED